MQNSKKKILIIVGIIVFFVGVFVGIFLFQSAENERLSFSHLCMHENEPSFTMVSISRREGEEGTVNELASFTSERKPTLWKEVKSVMDQYQFEKIKDRAKVSEFISVSCAFGEDEVVRIEIYSDATVLVLGGKQAGIYRASQSDTAKEAPYKELYRILTGEEY